jgi:hypothetical protein
MVAKSTVTPQPASFKSKPSQLAKPSPASTSMVRSIGTPKAPTSTATPMTKPSFKRDAHGNSAAQTSLRTLNLPLTQNVLSGSVTPVNKRKAEAESEISELKGLSSAQAARDKTLMDFDGDCALSQKETVSDPFAEVDGRSVMMLLVAREMSFDIQAPTPVMALLGLAAFAGLAFHCLTRGC